MFTKILYPTDFSNDAQIALSYIIKLKEAGNKEVIIVHIYDKKKVNALWEIKETVELGPANLEEKKVLDELIKQSYGKLEKIEKELNEVGFKSKIIVKVGNPAKEIIKISEEQKVNLIVIGAKGENAIEELFLGNTAMKIVRNAQMPVLVIKNDGGKK